MKTFGEKVVDFNKTLKYTGKLPKGFQVINPFLDNPETLLVMKQFYDKFYSDNNPRRFLIGINPGRHGAGVSGVPFTDTKRLDEVCGIRMESAKTHEISSVFVYDMIAAYGGAEKFYGDFYINSPFPLAIIRKGKNGQWVNANYYDDPQLFRDVEDFMLDSLRKHIGLGLDTSEVFILGKKNAGFIKKINDKANLFGKMTVFEHPRYIQQYKSKEKELYIDNTFWHLVKKNQTKLCGLKSIIIIK